MTSTCRQVEDNNELAKPVLCDGGIVLERFFSVLSQINAPSSVSPHVSARFGHEARE